MQKVCYRSGLYILLLLVSELAFAGQGYLEKEGSRMQVRDTLVTYDEKQSSLSIYLFPSRLSAQDKRAIVKGGSAFQVLWNKPSPDTKKWQWYPYAMLRLTGRNGTVNDLSDISNYYLMAYGISEKNFTDNVNGYFTPSDQPKLYKKRGSQVELKYQAMSDYSKLKWNLNIRSRIRN